MWIITLLSLLAGMVLGQRFKVMILVPLSAVALLATMATRAAAGDSLWHVVLGAAIVVTSLQIGYLIGVGARYALIVSRAGRLRPVPLAAGRNALRPKPFAD
jgi:predicted neutral ceramidase superfamily lipid hydrolase